MESRQRVWRAGGKAAAALVAGALVSCGGAAKDQVERGGAGGGARAEATPPALRLPRTVLPARYTAKLALDPATSEFTGHIEIEADVSEPTRVIWLNAEKLTIERATLTAGSTPAVDLEVIPVEHDFVGFRAPEEIPPGRVTLSIDYAGGVDAKGTLGIFHQEDQGDWYLFTQFEPLAARRAFPCFDEPDNKVTWKLSLEVPDDMVALTNTPELSSEPTGRGTRLVEFARTKPMPSYLVTFAVGPFELVDAGETEEGVELRIVTPKDRAEEADFAAEVTLELLELAEDYTGIPYPYEKLDSIAIPATVGFGAMEHPGLMTYTSRYILSKPEELTLDDKQDYVAVATHELAHQWFGNLVTMAWWDDIWLNEAFATWFEEGIIARYEPEWDADVQRVTGKRYAISADALATARKIHEPIETKNDIRSAFDGITYAKGAAVIRMFEDWVGEEEWRDAMRSYLEDHAWKNATAESFLGSISRTLGAEAGKAFSSFIEQVGVPLVSFDLQCEEGQAPKLALSQRRYLPIGSSANPDLSWRVPVCVEYPGAGGETARTCALLAGESGEIPLPGAEQCPAWFLPSGAELGYYRMKLPEAVRAALVGTGSAGPEIELDLPARVGLLDNLNAMVSAGEVPPAAALDLVERLARARSRHLVERAIDIVHAAHEYVPDEARPGYAKFIRRAFGARARKLGWKRRGGDTLDQEALRPKLVSLVGVKGRDDRLAAQAKEQVRAWLEDRKAVAPEMVDVALQIAARRGDEALFDEIYRAAREEEVMSYRKRLLGALGSFSEPELAKRALELVLSDELHIRESSTILYKLLHRETRRLVFDFVLEHFDELIEELPEQTAASLARVASAQCEPELSEKIASVFPEKIEPLPGGPRELAQALEKRELCLARKKALGEEIGAYFSSM